MISNKTDGMSAMQRANYWWNIADFHSFGNDSMYRFYESVGDYFYNLYVRSQLRRQA